MTFMKKTQKFCLLLSTIVTVTILTACTLNQNKHQDDTITVYLSDVSYLSTYAPYIQSQFPDLNIHFTVGRSSISFYDFLQKKEDLPDIMMIGSASMRDTLDLNPYLLDLSLTEVAASYHDSYLEQYRCEDQSIRWLPAGGVIHGILANQDLFKQYNIPLPTDYDSFSDACDAFQKLGIRGYTSDYKYDYTCLYTMEGYSVSDLTSLNGSIWRYNYLNGLTDQLDQELWIKIFKNTEQFIHDAGLIPDDTSRGYSMTRKDLEEGKLAMIRGTSSDIINYSAYGNMVMLPYFGKTEDDNWLLTEPAFHVALNGNLADNEERQAKTLEILNAMLSDEAINLLAENYLYVHKFSQDSTNQLPMELENLGPLLESNHLFIPQTGTALYLASKTAVQGLINGELTPESAYTVANKITGSKVTQESQTEIVFTSNQTYTSDFIQNAGNQAASAITNTLRTIAETDILFAPSYISTGSFYAGDYTLDQLDAMFMSSGNRLYKCHLTGAQIQEFTRLLVEGEEGLLKPFSKETLPIISGMKLTVQETEHGFTLKDISIDEKLLEHNKIYSVSFVDLPERIQHLTELAIGVGQFETFTSSEDIYARILWLDYLLAGHQLDSPTPYIILQ